MIFITKDEADVHTTQLEEVDRETEERHIPTAAISQLEDQAKYGMEQELDFWMLPKEKSKCVFLSDKGECSIYEIRPLECRLNTVTSNPYNCTKEATKEGTGIIINLIGLIN